MKEKKVVKNSLGDIFSFNRIESLNFDLTCEFHPVFKGFVTYTNNKASDTQGSAIECISGWCSGGAVYENCKANYTIKLCTHSSSNVQISKAMQSMCIYGLDSIVFIAALFCTACMVYWLLSPVLEVCHVSTMFVY